MELLNKITVDIMSARNHGTPEQINCGDCWLWAIVAARLTGANLIAALGNRNGHAFIKLNGIYYDAECPNGAYHWTSLPFFNRPGYSNSSSKYIEVPYTEAKFLKPGWLRKGDEIDTVKNIVESLAL